MRKIAKAPRPDTDPANYRPTSIKYRVYQGWLADGERGARAANALEQTPAVESTMKRWLWGWRTYCPRPQAVPIGVSSQ